MTTKIVGDSIPLPKTLAKKWQGKRVQFIEIGDEVMVLPQAKSRKFTAWRKLKPLGRIIKQRDIDKAIAEVRAERRLRNDPTSRS